MLEIAIFFIIFCCGIWLLDRFIKWGEKKKETIRDEVVHELANSDIENDIKKYKIKLEQINYIRKNSVQELLSSYNKESFEKFDDFFGNLGRCPKCRGGNLQMKISKDEKFIRCSMYPKCTYDKDIKVAELQYREIIKKQIIKDIQKAYS